MDEVEKSFKHDCCVLNYIVIEPLKVVKTVLYLVENNFHYVSLNYDLKFFASVYDLVAIHFRFLFMYVLDKLLWWV